MEEKEEEKNIYILYKLTIIFEINLFSKGSSC